MIIARLIGWIVFFAAIPVLATDMLVWHDTGVWQPIALGQLWEYLDYPSMTFMQELIERYVTPLAWDPVMIRMLAVWAFVGLMVLGVVVALAFRRREGPRAPRGRLPWGPSML